MGITTTYVCDSCNKPVSIGQWQGNVMIRLRSTNSFDKFFNAGTDIEIGDICQKCWEEKVYPILHNALESLQQLSWKQMVRKNG